MLPESIQTPVNQDFEDRSAAWKAHGDANDRATRHKLFIMAAMFALAVAIVSALSLLG